MCNTPHLAGSPTYCMLQYKKSKHWNFINESIKKLERACSSKIPKKVKYGNTYIKDCNLLSNVTIDEILFYSSFGTFYTLLKNLKRIYTYDFAEMYVHSTETGIGKTNYDNHTFFKLIYNTMLIRNRFSHNMQILSGHLDKNLSTIANLDSSELSKYNYNSKLLNTIYFVINNIEGKNRKYYLLKYNKLFKRNRDIIIKYHKSLCLDEFCYQTFK